MVDRREMERVDGAQVGGQVERGCVERVLTHDVRVARAHLIEQRLEPARQRVPSRAINTPVRAHGGV